MSFITLDEYPLDLIPFDNDLLSLEMGSSFKVHACYKGKFVVFFPRYQLAVMYILLLKTLIYIYCVF